MKKSNVLEVRTSSKHCKLCNLVLGHYTTV